MAKSDDFDDSIEAQTAGPGSDIPGDMFEKTDRWRPVITKIRVQCKGSTGGSWRFVGGEKRISRPGSVPTDEICTTALGMAQAHAEVHRDDGAKYRAHYTIQLEDGSEAPKYAKIQAVWAENGLIFEDDTSQDGEISDRERVLTEALEDARQIARQSGSLTLETMRTYTQSIGEIGSQVEKMCKGVASIGEALASSQRSVAEAMLQAGAMYREGQARSVEQHRLEAEARIIEREMDQGEKKWEMLTNMMPIAAIGVLQKLGVPPEHAVAVAQMMMGAAGAQNEAAMMGQIQNGATAITGAGMPGAIPGAVPAGGGSGGPPAGGGSAAPAGAAQATPTPRAPGWTPAPVDFARVDSREDGEGAATALACWFHERIEDEERKVRAIVGDGTYDAIRASIYQGDTGAGDALRAFGLKVSGLGFSAMKLLGELRAVLGPEALAEFQGLVNRARTGAI